MTQHDSSFSNNHDASVTNGIMMRGNDAGGGGGESACVSPIPMDPTNANEAESRAGSADSNRNGGGGVCGGKMMAIRVQMLDESITLFQVQVKISKYRSK